MMNYLLSAVCRKVIGLVTILVGGGLTVACYGPVAPQSDPTVVLTDFSYQPTATTAGETLTLNAILNKPSGAGCYVRGIVGSETSQVLGVELGMLYCSLNDSGYPPDTQADDGVWSGALVLPDDLPPQSGLPVSASLEWYDGLAGNTISSLELNVLPREVDP